MTTPIALTKTVTIAIDDNHALLCGREIQINGQPCTQFIVVVRDGIENRDSSALSIADIPGDTEQGEYLHIVQALADAAGTEVTGREFEYLSERLF